MLRSLSEWGSEPQPDALGRLGIETQRAFSDCALSTRTVYAGWEIAQTREIPIWRYLHEVPAELREMANGFDDGLSGKERIVSLSQKITQLCQEFENTESAPFLI